MELAHLEVRVEAVQTVRPPGGAERPRNGVLSCEHGRKAGVPPLRPWRDALEAYMTSSRLIATPSVA